MKLSQLFGRDQAEDSNANTDPVAINLPPAPEATPDYSLPQPPATNTLFTNLGIWIAGAVVVVALLAGLFFGGRRVYRHFHHPAVATKTQSSSSSATPPAPKGSTNTAPTTPVPPSGSTPSPSTSNNSPSTSSPSPTTTSPSPNQSLVNTGPGSVLAIFGGATVLGFLGYEFRLHRAKPRLESKKF